MLAIPLGLPFFERTFLINFDVGAASLSDALRLFDWLIGVGPGVAFDGFGGDCFIQVVKGS